MKQLKFIAAAAALLMGACTLTSAQTNEELMEEIQALKAHNESLQHTFDMVIKNIDDILWYEKVGDVAYIDKVYLTGEPKAKQGSPTSRGYNNPFKFWNYVFIPKTVDPDKKYPLIVFPHSGVHADMSTYYAHIIRELMAQEYIVIATEYRGSTGYGAGTYKAIDYGGRENSDVKAGRDYMIENYDIVDANRVGIMGWSHGGMITLMNLFEYPDAYKVGYAGVPVSDLIARMGIADDDYRALFSAPYHIGATVEENVQEYKRRSPVWNTHKLKAPLLVYSNTNDDDVDVLEVEHLIKRTLLRPHRHQGGHRYPLHRLQVLREVPEAQQAVQDSGRYAQGRLPFQLNYAISGKLLRQTATIHFSCASIP